MNKGMIGALALCLVGLTGCASAPGKPDCNLNLKSCLLHWDDYISDKRTQRNACINDACFEKGKALRQAEDDFVHALYLQGKPRPERPVPF